MGFAFAMKVMASLAAPSSLWWSENISQKPNLYQMLSSRPAAFGFVILAITAASLVISVCWLRSRELAALAAISLLVSAAAAATFARIPVQAHAIGGVNRPVGDLPLIFVMFIAVLLPWLTVICVTVVATARLISNRRGRADPAGEREPGGQQRVRRHPILLSVRGAATLLVVLTALLLLGVRPMANYPGSGPNSLRANAALAMIERSLPKDQLISLTVLSRLKADRYQVKFGLDWALTADGYQFNTTRSNLNHAISDITVIIGTRTVAVRVKQKTCRPVPDTISMPSLLCAPGA